MIRTRLASLYGPLRSMAYGLSAICLLVSLSLLLSGCSLRERVTDLFYRDVTRTMEIAQAHSDQQMAACAGFIQQQLAWTKKVLDEPTAGLISRAYRDYLALIEARGREREIEEACSGVVGMIAIKALRQMR